MSWDKQDHKRGCDLIKDPRTPVTERVTEKTQESSEVLKSSPNPRKGQRLGSLSRTTEKSRYHIIRENPPLPIASSTNRKMLRYVQ